MSRDPALEVAEAALALATKGRTAAQVDAAIAAATAGVQMLPVPAAAMTARTTNGAAAGSVEATTNKGMIVSLDFDASTQEYAQFDLPMPESWDEGTIQAEFVWSHPATTTNFGVVWGIQAVALADDDAQDAAFGTAQEVADTGGTTNDLYRSAKASAMTVAGSPAAGDLVRFQVYRKPSDGSDTMAVDARLQAVRLYITTAAAVDA